MADVNALLNFHTLSLMPMGMLVAFFLNSDTCSRKLLKKKKTPPIRRLDANRKKNRLAEEVFDWPDYVDKSLNSLPPEQQLYQWKERADTFCRAYCDS